MPKQTIEIDVPDGCEATGEYRVAVNGEWFLGTDFCAHQWNGCHSTSGPYPILRRLPDPVEAWLEQHPWLPDGCWVFKSYHGWRFSSVKPELCASGFYAVGSHCPVAQADVFSRICGGGFTPPPCDLVQVVRKKS